MKISKSFSLILICMFMLLTSCAHNTDNNDKNNDSLQSVIADSDESGRSDEIPSRFLLASTETELPFGKMKSEYLYDEKGHLTKITTYSKDKLSNVKTYKYDDNGYLIENATTVYDDSGNETSQSTETYVNSADGLIQSGTVTMSGTVATFINEYDDKGRVILYEQKDDAGNVLGKKQYEYLDDFGSFECVVSDNNVISNNRTQRVKYDEKGNVLENTWTEANGAIISSSVNVYDSHNNLIKTTNHDNNVTEQKNTYNNELLVKSEIKFDGELLSTIEYTYDEYNNLITKKQTSVSGTVETTVNVWTPVYAD